MDSTLEPIRVESATPSQQDTNEGEHGDTGHGDDDALKFRFLGCGCVGVLMIVHDAVCSSKMYLATSWASLRLSTAHPV